MCITFKEKVCHTLKQHNKVQVVRCCGCYFLCLYVKWAETSGKQFDVHSVVWLKLMLFGHGCSHCYHNPLKPCYYVHHLQVSKWQESLARVMAPVLIDFCAKIQSRHLLRAETSALRTSPRSYAWAHNARGSARTCQFKMPRRGRRASRL